MTRFLILLALGAVACATPEPQGADPCDGVSCRPGARCIDGNCVSDGPQPDSGRPTDTGRDTAPDVGNDAAPDTRPTDTNTDSGDTARDAEPGDTTDVPDPPDTPDPPRDVPPDAPPDVVEADTTPDVRDTRPDEPEACAVATAEATPATLPVDIIWVVDTSGSMDQETDTVEDKINDFARFITRSNIDYHVIMIGSNTEVCVPAPLSSGGCPDGDSDRYRHVRRSVDSHNALELVSTLYPQYSDFLRVGAQVHIVVVSDDESDWSASRFRVAMRDHRNPGFPGGFTFHSVVAFGDLPFFGCCGWQGCGAGIGQQYIDLANLTGGVVAPICQQNWDSIFTAIGDNVIEGSLLPCNFVIPDPGENLEVDPQRVNVLFTPGQGEPRVLPNYDSSEDCEGEGWYYDDPVNPTEVIMCPASCGFLEGSVGIEFGCDIVKG